jgi:hypothetical protein
MPQLSKRCRLSLDFSQSTLTYRRPAQVCRRSIHLAGRRHAQARPSPLRLIRRPSRVPFPMAPACKEVRIVYSLFREPDRAQRLAHRGKSRPEGVTGSHWTGYLLLELEKLEFLLRFLARSGDYFFLLLPS